MVASLEEATVDQLLDESKIEWNKDIIDGIFAPEEDKLIYRIPLSATASEDSTF